ncbi:MAG: molecular chaperone DnaJ [Pseudomonadota bacterium]
MIYLLLGIAVFALLVWTGRKARPTLAKPEFRIAAGALSGLAMAAGALLAVTGRVMPGVVIGGAGLVLAATARGLPWFGARRSDPAEVVEARDILGVPATASREEIIAAHARLIRALHPDVGGTTGLAARLNAARDTLLK